MAVNELRSFIILIYEYLVSKGSRLEAEYIELLDYHYRDLFASRPELKVTTYDLTKLIESKARFDEFCEIQKELYDIISLYKKGAFSDNV